MILKNTKKISSRALVVLLLLGQLVFAANFLFIPRPAKACVSIFGNSAGDCVIIDIPAAIKSVVTGILTRVAQNYANKYLTKLTEKIQDKYRIKDFLFYDQYLTDYYLTNAIMRNVKDPDLRQAFDLMAGVTITGRTRGLEGADPANALIPKLKQKMADIYISRGYIRSEIVYNPPPGVSDRDYFETAGNYFYSPPSFVESNLRGEFGAFQSAATTASQLEVTVGNGLKAGRIIGGTCGGVPVENIPLQEGVPYIPGTPVTETPLGPPPPRPNEDLEDPFSLLPDNLGPVAKILNKLGLVSVAQALHAEGHDDGPPVPSPNIIQNTPTNQAWDPVTCVAAGGKWNASLLDQARSLITNPTAFVNSTLDGAWKQIFGNNYNPNNIYTQIGQALGDFVFKKLNVKGTGDVFNEAGPNYKTSSAEPPKNIDLDVDGIPDGEDRDGPPVGVRLERKPDGKLISIGDTCYHGGLPPNCAKSSAVTTSAYFYPICDAADRAIEDLGKGFPPQPVESFRRFLEDNKYQNKDTQNFYKEYEEAAEFWGERASSVNGKLNTLIQAIKDKRIPALDQNIFQISKYNVWLGRIIESLYADHDVDLRKGAGNGGGSFYNLRENSRKISEYIQLFRKEIRLCANPSEDAGKIPDPGIDTGEEPEPCGGSHDWTFLEAPPRREEYFGELAPPAKYAADVREANRQALDEDAHAAAASRQYPDIGIGLTSVVISKLRAKGYTVGTATNCHNIHHPEDSIMVYKPGESPATRGLGEYYDLYRGFDVNDQYDYREAARRKDYGAYVGIGSLEMCTGCGN